MRPRYNVLMLNDTFLASLDVKTTANETFTGAESAQLAALIFKRFGRNEETAAAAWRRLLQNNCTTDQFMALVNEVER